jgi:hypothetical protein
MEGVTTAIVAFILACVIFPKVVKNKPQYYGAVAAVVLIILFGALGRIVGNDRFGTFIHVMTALLQVGALLLLILSAGGLSMKDLAGDLAETVEVVRRGGEKEIIIPRSGQTPKPRPLRSGYEDDEDRPARIDLDAELKASHPPPPAAPPPPKAADEDDRGIPLA